jgi:biopolymer transport protein ExbD
MRRRARRLDGSVALINVVFLLLIFVLAVGTLAPPLDGRVTLPSGADLAATAPPDALVVTADGALRHRGMPSAAGAYWAALRAEGGTVARLAPDRDAPAERLVELAATLRAAGAERVVIVAARGGS